MTNRRNFYRLLHVQPEAPVEVIRSSFRTLMKECGQHPDLGGSDQHAALLIEAYETLIDAKRRASYDLELRKRPAKNSRQPQAPEGTTPPPSRRSYGRMEKRGDLVYRSAARKSAAGEMMDLSPSGMSFLSAEELPIGCVIQISNSLLGATATVTQCRRTPDSARYVVGVKFIAVDFERPSGTFVSTTA